MKKCLIAVCLIALFLTGMTDSALAHRLSTAYFFEGVDLDLGKIDRDPTALLIVCGDPPNEVTGFLDPPPRYLFPDFKPPVDFYFDYDLNTESSIVFHPVLPAVEDESTYITGMFVLWDTAYDRVSHDLINSLVFPEEIISTHFSLNDSIVLRLNTGDYLRIGNFSFAGPALSFDVDVPVPEPATFLLVLLGLLGLWGIRKLKRGGKMFLFIALASMLLVSFAQTTHAQEAKPLYRLYIGEVAGDCGSDINCWSNHLDSGDAVATGDCQGRLGWVLDVQVPGTKPLYKIYRSHDTSGRDIKDDHLTTDTLSELVAGSVNEGIMGYVYTTQVPGTIPLYRKYRQYWYTIWGGTTLLHTDHITTTDINEGNSNGWVYERVLGYIIGPASSSCAPASPPIIPTLCDFATGIPQTECEALKAVYNNTNGENWTNNTGWLRTTTPCNWRGVTCDSGHVSALDLWQNQLNGPIPAEIGNLTHVTVLNLSHNQLPGSIPAEIGNLTNVQQLYLENSWLSGSIPPEIGNLNQVEIIALWRNQLNGSIPATLGNLSNLQGLYIGGNRLSGKIPVELGQLTNLRELHIQINQLSGSVPPQIGSLPQLESLRLHENQLSGPLPDALTGLTTLNELTFEKTHLCEPVDNDFQTWLASVADVRSSGVNCSICASVTDIPDAECNALERLYINTQGDQWLNNAGWLHGSAACDWHGVSCEAGHVTGLLLSNNQLQGELPPHIGSLSALEELRLDRNQLQGAIPEAVGQLANLTRLNLSENQLTGAIPISIRNLSDLRVLALNDNQLSGGIPAELAQLTQLQTLNLGNNRFAGNAPAALENLANLQELRLHDNPLNGALPETYSSLTALQTFAFQNTNLCEPDSPVFQGWLTGVTTVETSGLTCLGSEICASVSEIPQSECAALATLYDHTGGSNWLNNAGWGQTDAPCGWFGVSCAGGHVTRLELDANNLQGVLPAESAQLTELDVLNLSQNRLAGNIPDEIGDFARIRAIALQGNQLTGYIPATLGRLTTLEALSLSDNRLTGYIPSALGAIGANLRVLRLGGNPLSGSIPPEIVLLENLEELDLSQTNVSGRLPAQLSKLDKLNRLHVGSTNLKGSVPGEFMTFPGLTHFKFISTDLCEPKEDDFQDWLAGITDLERSGILCQDYFVHDKDEWGGTWHDAEKVFDLTDSQMCWAAAAANVLAWAGWGTLDFNTETAIFDHVKNFWTNAGGLAGYAWQWWLDGSLPPEDPNLSASQVKEEVRENRDEGGNYWQDELFSQYFQENWANNDWQHGQYLLNTIAELLHGGHGVVANAYPNSGESFGHSLTVWGYRYAPDGTITDIWVTDSDDSASELRLVRLELENYLWRIQDEEEKYLLKGIQAFQRNAAAFGTEMTILAQAFGGEIDPAGKVTVNQGDSQTFRLIPDPGYKLAQLLVDHRPVTNYETDDDGTYTYMFSNVQKDHAIEARFGMPITIKKISLDADGQPDAHNGGKALITYGDEVCDYECPEFDIVYEEGATYLLRVFPDDISEFLGWYVTDPTTGEMKLLTDKVYYAKPDAEVLAVIGRRSDMR